MSLEERFVKNLIHLRWMKKLSQVEISKTLGFKYSTYNAWENQRGVPKINDLNKICRFFKVTIDQMLLEDLSFNE